MPRAYLSALPRLRQTVTIRRIRARVWAPPHSYRSTQASISRTRYDSKVTREIVQSRDRRDVQERQEPAPLKAGMQWIVERPIPGTTPTTSWRGGPSARGESIDLDRKS